MVAQGLQLVWPMGLIQESGKSAGMGPGRPGNKLQSCAV
jgi:hypothetical protein